MKKLIPFALASLLLVSFVCTSCVSGDGKTDPTGDKDTVTEAPTQDATTGEPVTAEPVYELEPTDLGDYTFKVNVRSKATGNSAFAAEDFFVDRQSADVIKNAVYTRNQKLEKDFNIKIEQVDSATSQLDQITSVYLDGSKEYSAAIVLATEAATLATKGILFDLKSLPNLHFEQPYWDQNAVSQLSLGTNLYYTSGDSNISALDNAAATFFNISLLKKYNLEDPYKLVSENKWTLNKMMEMAETATEDSAGDGVDASDIAGYFTYSASGIYYFYASGERISTNNSEGFPEITVATPRSINVVESIFRQLNVSFNKNAIYGISKDRKDMFSTEKILFTDALLWDLRSSFRNMSVDYGIVPNPKFDTSQEEGYNSVVYFQDCVHLWCIPRTCDDTDKASLIMEAFAAYSTDTTMTAYYYQTLSYRALDDDTAISMLDIVKDSLVYDIALLYDWGGFLVFLRNSTRAASNTFSSYYDQNIERASADMQKTVQQFKGELVTE